MTWRVRATVERIVDGDTFVASLDLGWGIWRRETPGAPSRIRILDYAAPELREPRGAEAVAALAAIIPPGTVVWVESHQLDSFGRALCNVSLRDGTDILTLLPQEWQ